jgi:hypothetical protein
MTNAAVHAAELVITKVPEESAIWGRTSGWPNKRTAGGPPESRFVNHAATSAAKFEGGSR